MCKKIVFYLLLIIVVTMGAMDKDRGAMDKDRKKSLLFSLPNKHILFKKNKRQISQHQTFLPTISRKTIINFVFNNKDLLSCIAEQICITNNWNPKEIKKSFSNLMRVNRMIYHYFSQYYTDEPLARDFIKKIALHHNTHDQFAARDLGNKKIYDKISILFNIALGYNKLQFTESDLKDLWYLNSTGWCTCSDYRHATLLGAAIKKYNTEQVEILLNAGIDIYHKNTNPIQFMVQNYYGALTKEKRDKFRKIARLLIRKGIDPDSRFVAIFPTLLHAAAAYNDHKFATFLMRKGANPYKLWVNKDIGASISSDELLTEYDDRIPHFHNAFSINTQARDWLERIYSEIQKKNKRINQNRF